MVDEDGGDSCRRGSRDIGTEEAFRKQEFRSEAAVQNMRGSSAWLCAGKSEFELESKEVVPPKGLAEDGVGEVSPGARGTDTRVEAPVGEARAAFVEGDGEPEFDQVFRGGSTQSVRPWESLGGDLHRGHERDEDKESGATRRTIMGLSERPLDAASKVPCADTGCDLPSFLFTSPHPLASDVPVFREELSSCEDEGAGTMGSPHSGCLSLSQDTTAPTYSGNRGPALVSSAPSRSLDYFSISSSWGTAPSVSGTPTSYNLCATKGRQHALPPGQGAVAYLGSSGSSPAVGFTSSFSRHMPDHRPGHPAQQETLQHQTISEDFCFPETFQPLPQNASALGFTDSGAELKERLPLPPPPGAAEASAAQHEAGGMWSLGPGASVAGAAASLSPPSSFQPSFPGTPGHPGSEIQAAGGVGPFGRSPFSDENGGNPLAVASPVSCFPVAHARHPGDPGGASSPRRSPSLVSSSTTCPSHGTVSAASPHSRPTESMSPAFPYAGANLSSGLPPGLGQNLANIVSPLPLQHLLQLGSLSSAIGPAGFDRTVPGTLGLPGHPLPDLSQLLGGSSLGVDSAGTSNAGGGDRDNSSGSEASMKLACSPLLHPALRSSACGLRPPASASRFSGVGTHGNFCPPGGSEGVPQQPGRTFVGNIPPDITRAAVKRLAERYGTVIGLEYDPQPGRWAYAYIIFATSTMADRAVGAMHGKRAFEHAEFHRLVSCRCAKDFPLTRLPLTKMDMPCLNVPSSDGLATGGRGSHTPPRGVDRMLDGQLSSSSLSSSTLKPGWNHADFAEGSGPTSSGTTSLAGQGDNQPNAAAGVLAALGALGPVSAIPGLRTVQGKGCVLDPGVIQEQARKTTFTLLRDGPPGANLFIYGIPACWKELELMSLAGQFGHVVGIRVPPASSVVQPSSNFPSGGPIGSSNTNSTLLSCCSYNRGFGFVSYDNTSAAIEAFRQLSGLVVAGKALKIQLKNGEEHLLASALKTIASNPSPSPSPSWSPALSCPMMWDGPGPGSPFISTGLSTSGGLPSARSWCGGSTCTTAVGSGPTVNVSPASLAQRGPGSPGAPAAQQLPFPYSVPESPVQRFGSLPPAVPTALGQLGGSFLGGAVAGPQSSRGGAGRVTGSASSPFMSAASVCSSTSSGPAGSSRGGLGSVGTFPTSDPFLTVTAAGLCSLLATSGVGGKGGMTVQQQLLLQQAFSTMTLVQKQQLLLLLTQSSQETSAPSQEENKGERGGAHVTVDRGESSQVAVFRGPSVASSTSVIPEAGSGAKGPSVSSGGTHAFTLRDFLVAALSQQPSKLSPTQQEADNSVGANGNPVTLLQHMRETAQGLPAPTASACHLPPVGHSTEGGNAVAPTNPLRNSGEKTRPPLQGSAVSPSGPGDNFHMGEWEAFSGGSDRLFGTLLSQQNSLAFSHQGKYDTSLRFTVHSSGGINEGAATFFKTELPGDRPDSIDLSFLQTAEGPRQKVKAEMTPAERSPSLSAEAFSPRRVSLARRHTKEEGMSSTGGSLNPHTRDVSASLGSTSALPSDFCLLSRGKKGKFRDQCGTRAVSSPQADEANPSSSGSDSLAALKAGTRDSASKVRECGTARTIVHQLAQCVSMLASPTGFFRKHEAEAWSVEKAGGAQGEVSGTGRSEEKLEDGFADWNDRGREDVEEVQRAEESTPGEGCPSLTIPPMFVSWKQETKGLHAECIGQKTGNKDAKQWENETGQNATTEAAQRGGQMGVREGFVRDKGECHNATAPGLGAEDSKRPLHSTGVDSLSPSRQASLEDAPSSLSFFFSGAPAVNKASRERGDCMSSCKRPSAALSSNLTGAPYGSAPVPPRLGRPEANDEATAARPELAKGLSLKRDEGEETKETTTSSILEASLKDIADAARRTEVLGPLTGKAASGPACATSPKRERTAVSGGLRSWPLGSSGSSTHGLSEEEGRSSGPSPPSCSPFLSEQDGVPLSQRESSPNVKSVHDFSNGGRNAVAPPPPTFKASQRRVKRTDVSMLTSGGPGFLPPPSSGIDRERREGCAAIFSSLASSSQQAAAQVVCGRGEGAAPKSAGPGPSLTPASEERADNTRKGTGSSTSTASRGPLFRRPCVH
ncbi:RNA recognition motif-containing protein [Toxoplasma gondii RUB]|uniref:RNA recognition motif-containing protein n=1 Tax=Toxoplasma gondii RUB TaxID=935652 RepID=A0A086LXN1_TOXGO|nr:RNA recognition motif-containing protein [Toxoplasma gondii RUB]